MRGAGMREGENLSGEPRVRRSPVINECFQKAVAVYMA